MVRHRPDPRGQNITELYKWQSTLGPFRRMGFYYCYYKFYDWALKWPAIAALGVSIGIGIPIALYKGYSSYNAESADVPMMFKTIERLYEHSQWATDTRKTRGEWDNNFACWRDNPDCGKDYKQRYFS